MQPKIFSIVKKELKENKRLPSKKLIKILKEKYSLNENLITFEDLKKARKKICKKRYREKHKKAINEYQKKYVKENRNPYIKKYTEIEFYSNKWAKIQPRNLTIRAFASQLLDLYKANLDTTITINLNLVTDRKEKRIRITNLDEWFDFKPEGVTHLQFGDFLLEIYLKN